MLVIEIDGLIHQLPENKESDEIRTEWLNKQGFEVIRFTNEEVLNDIEKVLNKILVAIKKQDSKNPLEGLEALPFGEGQGGAGRIFVSNCKRRCTRYR